MKVIPYAENYVIGRRLFYYETGCVWLRCQSGVSAMESMETECAVVEAVAGLTVGDNLTETCSKILPAIEQVFSHTQEM